MGWVRAGVVGAVLAGGLFGVASPAAASYAGVSTSTLGGGLLRIVLTGGDGVEWISCANAGGTDTITVNFAGDPQAQFAAGPGGCAGFVEVEIEEDLGHDFDNQVFIPLESFKKFFSLRRGAEVRVKVKDKNRLEESRDELIGATRRVRGQLPGERDNFSINEQQAFKAVLDPVKRGIALAGLFITGLSLFVGAIGIMNITFVSVKKHTREIGTRKALDARHHTILLQFLIESTSLCLLGGFIGLGFAYVMCSGIAKAFPSFPIQFSLGLVLVSMAVSILTGLFSGFAPAWSASRLDPVAALRYE